MASEMESFAFAKSTNTEQTSVSHGDLRHSHLKQNMDGLMDVLKARSASRSWGDACQELCSVSSHLHQVHQDKSQLQEPISTIQKEIKVLGRTVFMDRIQSIASSFDLQCKVKHGGGDLTIENKYDLFKVHIQLKGPASSNSNMVQKVDVSMNNEITTCMELTEALNESNFKELHDHLECLTALDRINGDRIQKQKACQALGALEEDITTVGQIQSTFTANISNKIHNTPFGILQPRIGGRPMKLVFFVSPYDLLDGKCKSTLTMNKDTVLKKNVGYSLTISIVPHDKPHNLQVLPLVKINRTSDGKRLPVFQGITAVNSCVMPAVFVMTLNTRIPLSVFTILKIQMITGVAITGIEEKKSLVSLIAEGLSKKKAPYVDTGQPLNVNLCDQKHSYFLTSSWDASLKQGVLVQDIPFTHPTHVTTVLLLLRQQLLYNAVLASCVRGHLNSTRTATANCSAAAAATSVGFGAKQHARERSACKNTEYRLAKNDSVGNTLTFDVSSLSLQHMSVDFEHPLDDSIATVEIDLSEITSIKCKLSDKSSSTGPICTDNYLTQIIQRSLSLPMMLRCLFKKATSKLDSKLSELFMSMKQKVAPPPSPIVDAIRDAHMTALERRRAFAGHSATAPPTHTRPPPPYPCPPLSSLTNKGDVRSKQVSMENGPTDSLMGGDSSQYYAVGPPSAPVYSGVAKHPRLDKHKNPMLISLLDHHSDSNEGGTVNSVSSCDTVNSNVKPEPSVSASGTSLLSSLLGDPDSNGSSGSPSSNRTTVNPQALPNPNAAAPKARKPRKRRISTEKVSSLVTGRSAKRKPSEELLSPQSYSPGMLESTVFDPTTPTSKANMSATLPGYNTLNAATTAWDPIRTSDPVASVDMKPKTQKVEKNSLLAGLLDDDDSSNKASNQRIKSTVQQGKVKHKLQRANSAEFKTPQSTIKSDVSLPVSHGQMNMPGCRTPSTPPVLPSLSSTTATATATVPTSVPHGFTLSDNITVKCEPRTSPVQPAVDSIVASSPTEDIKRVLPPSASEKSLKRTPSFSDEKSNLKQSESKKSPNRNPVGGLTMKISKDRIGQTCVKRDVSSDSYTKGAKEAGRTSQSKSTSKFFSRSDSYAFDNDLPVEPIKILPSMTNSNHAAPILKTKYKSDESKRLEKKKSSKHLSSGDNKRKREESKKDKSSIKKRKIKSSTCSNMSSSRVSATTIKITKKAGNMHVSIPPAKSSSSSKSGSSTPASSCHTTVRPTTSVSSSPVTSTVVSSSPSNSGVPVNVNNSGGSGSKSHTIKPSTTSSGHSRAKLQLTMPPKNKPRHESTSALLSSGNVVSSGVGGNSVGGGSRSAEVISNISNNKSDQKLKATPPPKVKPLPLTSPSSPPTPTKSGAFNNSAQGSISTGSSTGSSNGNSKASSGSGSKTPTGSSSATLKGSGSNKPAKPARKNSINDVIEKIKNKQGPTESDPIGKMDEIRRQILSMGGNQGATPSKDLTTMTFRKADVSRVSDPRKTDMKVKPVLGTNPTTTSSQYGSVRPGYSIPKPTPVMSRTTTSTVSSNSTMHSSGTTSGINHTNSMHMHPKGKSTTYNNSMASSGLPRQTSMPNSMHGSNNSVHSSNLVQGQGKSKSTNGSGASSAVRNQSNQPSRKSQKTEDPNDRFGARHFLDAVGRRISGEQECSDSNYRGASGDPHGDSRANGDSRTSDMRGRTYSSKSAADLNHKDFSAGSKNIGSSTSGSRVFVDNKENTRIQVTENKPTEIRTHAPKAAAYKVPIKHLAPPESPDSEDSSHEDGLVIDTGSTSTTTTTVPTTATRDKADHVASSHVVCSSPIGSPAVYASPESPPVSRGASLTSAVDNSRSSQVKKAPGSEAGIDLMDEAISL